MPAIIEFTEDRIGVVIYGRGIVTGEELIAAIKQVYQDERFLSLRYWIGDHTLCERFLPNEAQLVEIARLNEKESKRNPGILLALVAPSPESFGVSRQFSAHGSESEYITSIFRDRQSADEWIQNHMG